MCFARPARIARPNASPWPPRQLALVSPPPLVAVPEKHPVPKPTEPVTVLFSLGSAKLGDDSLKVLREAVSGLPATTRFTIMGHTDEVGSRKFNEQLARKRAGAVMDALLTLGITRCPRSTRWTRAVASIIRPRSTP